MELPAVGQQCYQVDCKQLDFLPLQCECKKKFCSDHFKIHIQSCPTHRNVEVEPRKIEKLYQCNKTDCQETSIVPLLCPRCNQHFCIKHRHLVQCEEVDPKKLAEEKEKYAAPVRQFNKAKDLVDQQVEDTLKKARLKGKNEKMANKVQLMKIKNKATGLKSIPTSDRIYFSVEHLEKSYPVFISKNWTIGRIIDAIADELKLKNNNNKSNEKKLRLFKTDSGEVISKNLAELLSNLLGTKIIDGENLVIKYVDDDCEYL